MMTESFWEQLANVHWLVYALIIYLLRIAYLTTQPRIVYLRYLYFMPVFLILFSALNLYVTSASQPWLTLAWLAGAVPGTYLGWLLYEKHGVKAIASKKQLYLPGSWVIFSLVVISFCVQAYYFYYQSEDISAMIATRYTATVIFIYGIFTGIFSGRLAFAIHRIKNGPYVQPEAIKLPSH